MTTIRNQLWEIERSHVVTLTHPQFDTAASSWTTSQTTWSMSAVDVVPVGAVLNAGFELAYVTNWNTNTRTATVIRGFLGSTAAAASAGDLIRVNPRFTDIAMWGALVSELRSWDERLFKVEQDALTFGANDTSIEATPTLTPYRILDARPRPPSSATVAHRTRMYPKLRYSENTGEFASGYSIHADYPFGISTTVDVLYAVPFTLTNISTDSTIDLQSTVGLTDDMLEILTWGVLYRLLAGREVGRVDPTVHQRPDLAEAVPGGLAVRVAEEYKRMRDAAYNESAKKLLARWPYRYAG